MKIVRLALLLIFSTGVYLEADWPQWRGPTRNGVAASGPELLAELSEEQELPLVWESEEIPSDKEGGHGSMVVADGRVYLALVWHKLVSKDERIIDDKLIRSLGHRKVELAPEILAKHEADRMKLSPRLRGSALDEWIMKWVETHLD